MNILHYALGFPPYRTGGLTKYVIDLAKEQVMEGHNVSLIWPGEIKIIGRKNRIKKRPSVYGINSFEIINPLPVSYDEGIVDLMAFTQNGDKEVYIKFLKENNIEVIHFHTFMGLHEEFVDAAKELGIRTVYTSHDFFAICPKVTLCRNGKLCEEVLDFRSCPECNLTALSMKKMIILQSPLYRTLKDSRIVKKLRKRHRDTALNEVTDDKVTGNKSKKAKHVGYYIQLRAFYKFIYDKIDFIHFNSSVSRMVYDKCFGKHRGKVISISHANIRDNKKEKKFSDELRITYIAAPSAAKGYYMLIDTLDKLWEEGKRFSLNTPFISPVERPYLNCFGHFDSDELGKIFDDTDILVAPSVWYETFGFTVLEALSFGVPVLISDHVGAKDIIPDDSLLMFKDQDELYQILKDVDKAKLKVLNKNIVKNVKIKLLSDHAKELEKEAYR